MPGTMFVATFFFEALEGKSAGWSESFYLNGSGLNDAFTRVTRTALINRRRNLLSVEYGITAVRVSDIEVRGDSLFANFGGSTGNGTLAAQVTATEDVSEEPWDGLLIRMEAGATRRRGFIMRGLPLGVTTRNYGLNLVNPFVANFVSWKTDVVLGLPYAVRTRTVGADVNPPPTSVALTATTQGLILNYPANAVPAALVADGVIRLSNAARGLGINGDWKIRLVIPTLGQVVLYDKRQTIPCVPSGLVFVKLVGPQTLVQFSNALMERGASRKTGRPFGSLVGRRKARRA